jgi:serine/threonine protein kinase
VTLTSGQMLSARYRVVSLLGQGGFGAVYKGWDINLNKPVAIKENLDPSADADRQFQREAQILSNLRHPNLTAVTDYFLLPGVGQYLVMDFVEGEDLQAMIDRVNQPLPEAQVLNWISQVCDVVAYLHTQIPPIIHRDIKPANIKITPQGKALLVDFGISKIYDQHQKTTAGARAVTPGFSPWEQYGQGTTDVRSDVYALGATLYTLLTNEVPPEAIALMGGAAQLTRPRTLNPRISIHVEKTIQQAMTTQPAGRFANAGQFKTSLATPIVVSPPVAPPIRPVPATGATYQQASPTFNSNAYPSTATTSGAIWWKAAPLPLIGSVVVGALWAFFSLWSVAGILRHAIYLFAGWRYASTVRGTGRTFSRGQIFWRGVALGIACGLVSNLISIFTMPIGLNAYLGGLGGLAGLNFFGVGDIIGGVIIAAIEGGVGGFVYTVLVK